MMSKTHIQDCYTLITGASSGIGMELARLCAADGRSLILVARRLSRLQALKDELGKKVSVVIFSCDLSYAQARQQLLAELEVQQLEVNCLMNNAGCGQYGLIAENDWHDSDAMLQLNMVALSHLCRSLLPAMLQRNAGYILNIASTAAFQPGPMMAAYFASKAYVLSYTEALAYELNATGVSATCLCPGATQTEFFSLADMQDSNLIKDKPLACAKSVAKQAYQAMLAEKSLSIHGVFNQLLAFSNRLAPRKLLTMIAASLLKRS